MKICFTSALFGNKDKVDIPVMFERIPKYDYFLFTDIDKKHFDTGWDIINIKDHPKIVELTSNIRKSRYPKFMSWELLDSLKKNYDVVFYCDVYLTPNIEKDWVKLAREIKDHNFGFTQELHPQETQAVKEMKRILRAKKDSKESIDKTKSFFQKYDPTIDLASIQAYTNTTFGYDFLNEKVRKITKEFWKIYTTEDITYRDQPLWNFLIFKNGYTPLKNNLWWNGNFFLRTGHKRRHRYT